MRIEVREIPTVQKEYVYIADDGTEFNYRSDCETYEYKLSCGKRDIPCHTVESIEEEPTSIYLIKDQDDFDWLKKVEWAHCDVEGKFSLPGWYVADFHNGGDGRDWYIVEYMEDYVNRYQKILDDMKNYLV